MKTEELDKGKALVAKAIKWWSATVPGFEQEMYKDEPIPALVRWLKSHAFPELERNDDSVLSIGLDVASPDGEPVVVRTRKK